MSAPADRLLTTTFGQSREMDGNSVAPFAHPKETIPLSRQPRDMAVVALVVFLSCLFGIYTRPAGMLASFWPANAVLLGLMVRNPRLATPLGWLAAVGGFVAADYLTGGRHLPTWLLTAGNLAGVLTGYVLFKRLSEDHKHLRQPISVLYLIFVVIAAAIASGVIGAFVNRVLFHGGIVDGFLLWSVTEFVNYVAILPMLLTMHWPGWNAIKSHRFGLADITLERTVPFFALVVSCAISAFVSRPGSLTFPVPALLWCAITYSLPVTAVLALAFTMWTLLAISFGHLLVAGNLSDHATLMSLRLGVVLMALAPIVVASVMAARASVLRRLHEKNLALDEADRAKDRFLAIMSHELRTPLTGVLGMTDLLAATGLTTQQEKLNRTLARSARTLLSLLNDILDFSKIEAGRLQIESRPFLLSETILDVRDLFAGVASEKRLAFEVNFICPHDTVVGDQNRLRQVLSNLIGNAIKFTHGGSVTVNATQELLGNGELLLKVSVSDTGIGIPRDKLALLFRPYAQADVSIGRKFGGTGLGLAISRNLVRAMGGDIEAASIEGKGSTFSFFIRLRTDESAAKDTTATQAAAKPSTDRNPRHYRFLLAEDNETTRMLVTTMLEREGHAVTAVEDGALAVNAMKLKEYDIVLIDMHMPHLDGIDAVSAIRAIERKDAKARIPIIAMTADVSPGGRETYLKAGADAVVDKPVEWPELFDAVEKLAGSPSTVNAAKTAKQENAGSAIPHSDAVINDETIANLRSLLSPSSFERLLDVFLKETEAYKKDISAAVKSGDLAAAKRIAHALKGMCDTLGAAQVGALARRIEQEVSSVEDASSLLPACIDAIDAAQKIVMEKYKHCGRCGALQDVKSAPG